MDMGIKQEILNIKNKTPKGIVNFYNDGSVSRDDENIVENLDLISYFGYHIKNLYLEAAKSYVNRGYDFDTIELDLKMGLIYNEYDVNDDNTIKEGKQPMKNCVRIYTGRVKSYLDDEQTNTSDYYDYGMGYQNVAFYNSFIRDLERYDFEFIGPKTYEEFKEKILNGETFDVKVSLSLKEENERDSEINVKPIKKLFRRK